MVSIDATRCGVLAAATYSSSRWLRVICNNGIGVAGDTIVLARSDGTSQQISFCGIKVFGSYSSVDTSIDLKRGVAIDVDDLGAIYVLYDNDMIYKKDDGSAAWSRLPGYAKDIAVQ